MNRGLPPVKGGRTQLPTDKTVHVDRLLPSGAGVIAPFITGELLLQVTKMLEQGDLNGALQLSTAVRFQLSPNKIEGLLPKPEITGMTDRDGLLFEGLSVNDIAVMVLAGSISTPAMIAYFLSKIISRTKGDTLPGTDEERSEGRVLHGGAGVFRYADGTVVDGETYYLSEDGTNDEGSVVRIGTFSRLRDDDIEYLLRAVALARRGATYFLGEEHLDKINLSEVENALKDENRRSVRTKFSRDSRFRAAVRHLIDFLEGEERASLLRRLFPDESKGTEGPPEVKSSPVTRRIKRDHSPLPFLAERLIPANGRSLTSGEKRAMVEKVLVDTRNYLQSRSSHYAGSVQYLLKTVRDADADSPVIDFIFEVAVGLDAIGRIRSEPILNRTLLRIAAVGSDADIPSLDSIASKTPGSSLMDTLAGALRAGNFDSDLRVVMTSQGVRDNVTRRYLDIAMAALPANIEDVPDTSTDPRLYAALRDNADWQFINLIVRLASAYADMSEWVSTPPPRGSRDIYNTRVLILGIVGVLDSLFSEYLTLDSVRHDLELMRPILPVMERITALRTAIRDRDINTFNALVHQINADIDAENGQGLPYFSGKRPREINFLGPKTTDQGLAPGLDLAIDATVQLQQQSNGEAISLFTVAAQFDFTVGQLQDLQRKLQIPEAVMERFNELYAQMMPLPMMDAIFLTVAFRERFGISNDHPIFASLFGAARTSIFNKGMVAASRLRIHLTDSVTGWQQIEHSLEGGVTHIHLTDTNERTYPINRMAASNLVTVNIGLTDSRTATLVPAGERVSYSNSIPNLALRAVENPYAQSVVITPTDNDNIVTMFLAAFLITLTDGTVIVVVEKDRRDVLLPIQNLAETMGLQNAISDQGQKHTILTVRVRDIN